MRELLAAAFKTAGERLDLLVNDLVGADIASLGEPLATGFTGIRSFASVAALMRLPLLEPKGRRVGGKSPTLRLPNWENRCPHDFSLHI